MRIALVHDYLVQYGGAERVLECFAELFPYAPIYTLVYDKRIKRDILGDKNIRASFLQKLPFSKTKHRLFPPLMPMAIEQFDFSQYDVVLSDSSSYAKGIITGPDTLHICYMHTPMRYAWDDCQKYTDDFYFPALIKKMVPFAMNYIRVWDRISADRVDRLIANSDFIARRIKKYYKKDCVVIHPPVAVNNFYVSSTTENYFLMVGRLMPNKRFDLAIEAFNQLKLPLKIIGRGPELKKLQKMAGPNIEFLGRVEDEKLAEYYAKCQAFVFTHEEDFGIVAIEALASGRPVVAFRGGDIPEHVEEGKTGIFFDCQDAKSLIEAIKKLATIQFNPQYIRSTSLKFDREIFKSKIKEYVEGEVERFRSTGLR